MLCVSFWNVPLDLHAAGHGLERQVSANEAGKYIENWRRKGWLACVFKEIADSNRTGCSMMQLCAALHTFGIPLKVNDFLGDAHLNVLMDAPRAHSVEWIFLDCYYTVDPISVSDQRDAMAKSPDTSSLTWPVLSELAFVLRRAP